MIDDSKPLTRQQRFTENRKSLGLCVQCSDKASEGHTLCDLHLEHAKQRSRTPQARERVVRSRNKLRSDVFNAYGGCMCICCGESILDFLTIDHINNDGNEERRRLKMSMTSNPTGDRFYGWLKKQGFPPRLSSSLSQL